MPTNPPRKVTKTEQAKKTTEPYLPVVALVCFFLGGALAQIEVMAGLTLAGAGGFILGKLYR